ncbi:MAG: ABC transporter ATP-binding protein [Chloroflexi bacterium]|nr:ABC transporter ATP-binding protein [Chloroflexota bacterium]
MMPVHDGGWWSFLRYDEQQDRPQISRTLLRRVAAYASPYVGLIAAMLATILVISLLSVVPPLLYRDLIDRALPDRDGGRLSLLALGMVAVPLLSGLTGVLQRYLSAQIGEGIIFDLRRQLFDHIQRQSLRFFTNTKTGELMSRLNNDVVGAQQAVTSTLVSIVSNAVALAATLAVMLSLEWRLTLIAVAILPLFLYPARRVGRTLRHVTRQSLTLNAQMNALMNETLNVSGALLVKIFGRAPHERDRFAERAAAVRDVGVRSALIGRWFFMGLSLVSAVGTALVFWLGGQLVLAGELSIGTIVAFGALLVQLYGPLSALTNARVEFATSLVSFERVFEVLDLPVEIADAPTAVPLASDQSSAVSRQPVGAVGTSAGAPVGRAAGAARFEHVWFSYQEAERPAGLAEVVRWSWSADPSALVHRRPRGGESGDGTAAGEDGFRAGHAEPRWTLQDVSFEIQPGQIAALVGPSGAGKTTVTYLLPRLYDPTRGRILIDGHDVRTVTLESLARQIGTVTQETYLFHDTILANLRYARPRATMDEVVAACRAANIHDFIAGLPDGYHTVVGERGYRLSGGEKQRVAIARVLLKDPCILILDEATSHLDSQSEALIQAALERAMAGRTSLVIAHRLSTVLAADVILVMDGGRLVERGTHEELLARGGLYATLYETQFRAVQELPGAA